MIVETIDKEYRYIDFVSKSIYPINIEFETDWNDTPIVSNIDLLDEHFEQMKYQESSRYFDFVDRASINIEQDIDKVIHESIKSCKGYNPNDMYTIVDQLKLKDAYFVALDNERALEIGYLTIEPSKLGINIAKPNQCSCSPDIVDGLNLPLIDNNLLVQLYNYRAKNNILYQSNKAQTWTTELVKFAKLPL